VSWEAEDAVIRRVGERFGPLGEVVEVRNQARVHLWYEQKFGRPCPAHPNSESAIDAFAATACCFGVRLDANQRMRVYAPHAFADLFSLVLRPNPVLAPRGPVEQRMARAARAALAELSSPGRGTHRVNRAPAPISLAPAPGSLVRAGPFATATGRRLDFVRQGTDS
jgi:hypothetical protein